MISQERSVSDLDSRLCWHLQGTDMLLDSCLMESNLLCYTYTSTSGGRVGIAVLAIGIVSTFLGEMGDNVVFG